MLTWRSSFLDDVSGTLATERLTPTQLFDAICNECVACQGAAWATSKTSATDVHFDHLRPRVAYRRKIRARLLHDLWMFSLRAIVEHTPLQ